MPAIAGVFVIAWRRLRDSLAFVGGLLISGYGFAAQAKREVKIKTPAEAGVCILAETEGFAHVPQAAESLASDSLRIPRVSQTIGLLVFAKEKSP